MFSCLVSAKYNMKATLLTQGTITTPTDPDSEFVGGEFVTRQDPDTGEIIRVWVPIEIPDDPDTVPVESAYTFDCIARGIIDGGIRVAGTIENFNNNGEYVKADYVKMSFAPNIPVNDRSRITNIKGPSGNVIWKEEETDGSATIFDVLGVTPVIDPFGEHIENIALLQRAPIQ